MVRAKFTCVSIQHLVTQSPHGVAAVVTLAPVYGTDSDNAAWSKYTPQGKLEMTLTTPGAIAAFTLGEAYYLDIQPVPVPKDGAVPITG